MAEINDADVFAGLKFFAEAEGYNRPFNGLNQQAVLFDIFARKNSNVNRFIDIENFRTTLQNGILLIMSNGKRITIHTFISLRGIYHGSCHIIIPE